MECLGTTSQEQSWPAPSPPWPAQPVPPGLSSLLDTPALTASLPALSKAAVAPTQGVLRAGRDAPEPPWPPDYANPPEPGVPACSAEVWTGVLFLEQEHLHVR